MAHIVQIDKFETKTDDLRRLVPKDEYNTQADMDDLRRLVPKDEYSTQADMDDLRRQLEEYLSTHRDGSQSEVSIEHKSPDVPILGKGGSKSRHIDKDQSISKRVEKEKVEKDDHLSNISLADERGGRRRGKNVGEEEYFGEEEKDEKKEVVEAPTEVSLDAKIIDTRGCKDGYILLARESYKQPPHGKIGLSPLPFLGHFTAFGRQPRVTIPPKVQSRWKVVKIPLRGDFGPKCPIDKYAHPIDHPSSRPSSKEYRRPLIPINCEKRRRLLHRFSVSGDKNHLFKLLIPSGYFRRKVGGGWICRRWIKRRWPRKLINHTKEEWKAALALKEKKEKIEEEKFKATLSEVWNGIIGLDQGIMKETYLTLVKENERRSEKKKEMYDQWDLKIFNYIQRQTQEKINDDHYDPQVVTAKQMDLQRKYCKAMQRRKVFLDIIHPEEYNPYEYQDTTMKYSTKALYDPIKHDWLKEKQEKAFMGEAIFDKSRTRQTFELANWTEPEYKACMGGRVCCDNELIGERTNLAPVPQKWVSHPVLYNKRWGPEFWHTSFPKGGKACDGPRPANQMNLAEKPWRGIGIVWDAPPKHQQKLQISEENPWF